MCNILTVLGIDKGTVYFQDKMNVYHSGDREPFANIVVREGVTHLIVNAGEVIKQASTVVLPK